MTDLKTDEEKAEELKRWWRDNGTSVLAGVALAVAGTFGWQQWQAHQVTQTEAASDLLAQMKSGTGDKASIIEKLTSEYSSTPYAAFAALEKAKDAESKNDSKASLEALRLAADSKQTSVARIAKLRLIRTLIASGGLDEANTLLSEKLPSAFTSLHEELKGDLYLAKKEIDKARQSYDRAILSAGRDSVELLKMKRNNLGEGA